MPLSTGNYPDNFVPICLICPRKLGCVFDARQPDYGECVADLAYTFNFGVDNAIALIETGKTVAEIEATIKLTSKSKKSRAVEFSLAIWEDMAGELSPGDIVNSFAIAQFCGVNKTQAGQILNKWRKAELIRDNGLNKKLKIKEFVVL